MKWIKQHWRGITRIFAVLLFGVGAFCGYWWFYKLAPARRTLDPSWYAAHSPKEYWLQVQKGIHRGRWLHGYSSPVGQYGDKSWAEWIMAHVRPGTSMGCIGGGPSHSATSMRYITNQDVGESADDWLLWWEENKLQSQENWIADGFRIRGFHIDVPPTTEQIPVLLEVMGNSTSNELTTIPEEMKYNAFRFLRDSGFEPMAYALTNRAISPKVESGLMEYARMERRSASANDIGILAFGDMKNDLYELPIPMLLTTRYQITANALVFGAPLLGTGLLILSCRKKKKFEHGGQPNREYTVRLP